MGFLGAVVVKNLPANARDVRDLDFIPGSRRSPGGGHGNPFQYSCLGNPKDRGAWLATVHGFTKKQTLLSDLAHSNIGTSLWWKFCMFLWRRALQIPYERLPNEFLEPRSLSNGSLPLELIQNGLETTLSHLGFKHFLYKCSKPGTFSCTKWLF